MRQKPENTGVKAYMKYMGLAMQFFFIIGLAAWLGSFLDKKFAFEKAYLTLALVMLAFLMMIVRIYIDLNKKSD